jgi:transposase
VEGGRAALARADDASKVTERDLCKKVAALERALGRKSYELEVAGELSRGWE